jgi:hypothetical protein
LIDPEDHMNLIVIDFHPLHQGADQLSSVGPSLLPPARLSPGRHSPLSRKVRIIAIN